jgi:hypothetical protein
MPRSAKAQLLAYLSQLQCIRYCNGSLQEENSAVAEGPRGFLEMDSVRRTAAGTRNLAVQG